MKIKVLFYFFFVFYLALCFEKGRKKSCGFDSIKYNPKPSNKIIDINQIKSLNVASTSYETFNIYLDLFQYNDEIKKFNLTNTKTFFNNALDKATNTLTKLLKVRTQIYNFVVTDEQIKDLGIYKWNKERIGNITMNNKKGLKSFGIDLYIFVKLEIILKWVKKH